mgnify:CR=1 FL=1
MLLIVLTLALGFSMLLLIAVLLCAVITFTRPVDTPRLPARLAVIGVSLAMTAAAAAANAFDEDFGTGLSELVNSLSDLRLIAQGVQADAAVLLTDTQSVGVAVEAIAVCLGCPHLQSGAASSAMTSEAMCKDLAARRDVIVHGQMFAEDVRDGPAHFQRAIDTLRYATGWHSWTTSLPFFALLMTACAVTIGTCVGRRSLLVGTQFFAVIAWWMLCAITAIQLAIAVRLPVAWERGRRSRHEPGGAAAYGCGICPLFTAHHSEPIRPLHAGWARRRMRRPYRNRDTRAAMVRLTD